MENKISVVINTYNAEKHLEKVLISAKDFDEIVICDMESTDDTVRIAQKYGCKIVSFPKKDYVSAEPARNFAIQSATHPWVLVIDADEIVTNELREYLYTRIKDGNCPAGLYIPRKNYIMNRFLKNSYPDSQLRFFKKEGADWPPFVHTFPKVDGETEKIPASRMELALIHISDTIYDQLFKLNQYTENEIIKRAGQKVSVLKMFAKCTLRFLKNYILRGGFCLGTTGLVQAINSTNYKFYTLAKIWENANNAKVDLPEIVHDETINNSESRQNDNKISVVINTYNEESSLAEILEYLRDFDEIVVCDMESTDNTVGVAEKFGCKVVNFPKGNYSIVEPARNFAIHSAKHPWVLVVDADEIVTNELRRYLYEYISKPDCKDGLLIARKNYIMNTFVKNSYPDYQLRFFRQSKATWPPIIHKKPTIDGAVEKIPAARRELAMIHKSMTLHTKLAKMNIYTQYEIEKRAGEGVNILKIFASCTFRFFRHYIIKGGIFHGISGLVLSINEANYKFYTLAKIWEHNNAKKSKDNL